MDSIVKSFSLFFGLVNPFLLSIYLLEHIRRLDRSRFRVVLTRALVISAGVFVGVGWSGEALFTRVLNLRLESFQIFGGVVFLLIGIRFVLTGAPVVADLRGSPEFLGESTVLPFMIGPGTVSASIVIGNRHSLPVTAGVIGVTLLLSAIVLYGLKVLHDRVQKRNALLVDRYVEIVGRLSGLFVGTVAMEMILEGIGNWLELLP